MKMPMKPDSDRPLITTDDDRFSFGGIAKRLAPAILKTLETDGMVVGLEGRWGAGKTTLLNFLRSELETRKPDNIHVISIAPWLNGDHSNLVFSLLIPIADLLDQAEDKSFGRIRRFWRRTRKKGSAIGRTLRDYGAKTGRTLVPAARLAESFLPGAKLAGDGLEVSSKYLGSMQRRSTTAEIKAEISKQLTQLDIGFVVILDDLDRLEPEQAVEVVRLVRSVADFPKMTYIMCYDRVALSHALMSGLKVSDGDQFLQKIVQLTFTMPLPEPFELRGHFLEEALAIFEAVTGHPPSGDLLDDLKSAVDREGGGMRTPREVKLALNSIRFLYPEIMDDVYFPDMCRLQLIKTTHPALYRWIEEYLAERSVMVTGDGSISKDGKKDTGERLKALLPAEDPMSTQSIWALRRYIPGVVKSEKAEDCVFASTNVSEVKDMIEHKRLGSPVHYRHYFALTYPKTVMPDNELNLLFDLAVSDRAELTKELVRLAQRKRPSGKSWFEHVLDRLDKHKISSLDTATISGIISAIANGMDAMLAEDANPSPFALTISDLSVQALQSCLKQLRANDPMEFESCAVWLASNCPSMNWLVGKFFRNELYTHGRVGDSQQSLDASPFSGDELDRLLKILRERAAIEATSDRIGSMHELGAYLYGWRDLSGIREPKDWVERFVEADEGFLFLLNKLRGWAMSDRVYYPLQKAAVEDFLDWEHTIERLKALSTTLHADKAKDLMAAIEQGKH